MKKRVLKTICMMMVLAASFILTGCGGSDGGSSSSSSSSSGSGGTGSVSGSGS